MKQLCKIVLMSLAVFFAVLIVVITTPYVQSMILPQSNFDFAIRIVLEHEGGLTNSPHDSGGLTSYGISLKYIKDEHIDINGDGKVDKNDILQLTQTEADNLYLNDWFRRYHYDKIKDKFVATKVFDFAVNAGAGRAAKIAKQALNSIHGKFFQVNGELDDRSIALINATEPAVMMDALRSEEAKFYRDIVKRNRSLAPFERGWLKRASW